MKHVQESLMSFNDTNFFDALLEDKKDGDEKKKEGLSPAEKKSMKDNLEKQGMKVINKCAKNFKAFVINAGDIWQEYRDFWEAQKESQKGTFTDSPEGEYYDLWESDYIVGVEKKSDGNAILRVFNTQHKDTDEYIVFESTNPNVVKAFKEFMSGVVKAKMSDVISAQKHAMDDKKANDLKTADAESKAAKSAKFDAFMNEAKLAKKRKKKLNDTEIFESMDDISMSNKQTRRMGNGPTFKTNIISRLINNFRMPETQAVDLFDAYYENDEFSPEKLESVQYNWDMVAWAVAQEIPLDDPSVMDKIPESQTAKAAKKRKKKLNESSDMVREIVDQLKNYFPEGPSEFDIVEFVIENHDAFWKSSEEMNEEGEFPEDVLSLLRIFNLDYNIFSEEFNKYMEGEDILSY